MATNFTIPFSITTQGTISTVSDPDSIAMQRVRALISTPTNSRVMLPDYGVNLPAYLFAPDLPETADKLANDIRVAVQTWEPTINILQISPVVNNAKSGFEDVNVEFSRSGDQTFTPTLTATVLVGGTVVGD